MIDDIHHLGLSVRDVEVSASWYVDVLGFSRTGEYSSPDGSRRKVFLRHDHLRARLGLTQHRSRTAERFDETAPGLDHLAFSVSSRDELDRWVQRFSEAGVRFSSAGTRELDRRRHRARLPRPGQHPARAVLRPINRRTLNWAPRSS